MDFSFFSIICHRCYSIRITREPRIYMTSANSLSLRQLGPPLAASEREFKIKNVPTQECIVVCVVSLEDVNVTPDKWVTQHVLQLCNILAERETWRWDEWYDKRSFSVSMGTVIAKPSHRYCLAVLHWLSVWIISIIIDKYDTENVNQIYAFLCLPVIYVFLLWKGWICFLLFSFCISTCLRWTSYLKTCLGGCSTPPKPETKCTFIELLFCTHDKVLTPRSKYSMFPATEMKERHWCYSRLCP